MYNGTKAKILIKLAAPILPKYFTLNHNFDMNSYNLMAPHQFAIYVSIFNFIITSYFRTKLIVLIS